jgi:hypothetical protein
MLTASGDCGHLVSAKFAEDPVKESFAIEDGQDFGNVTLDIGDRDCQFPATPSFARQRCFCSWVLLRSWL